jgi:hypothetical protein
MNNTTFEVRCTFERTLERILDAGKGEGSVALTSGRRIGVACFERASEQALDGRNEDGIVAVTPRMRSWRRRNTLALGLYDGVRLRWIEFIMYEKGKVASPTSPGRGTGGIGTPASTGIGGHVRCAGSSP